MSNEWDDALYALNYLARAGDILFRSHGESVLVGEISASASRVLDLGTGDGRLLALVLDKCKCAEAVALDHSPTMIEKAQIRFRDNPSVSVVRHDLNHPLPSFECFDAVISSFAIHHVADERKRSLYLEIFDVLIPGGVVCNLEHVSSPTQALHAQFLSEMGLTEKDEDPSNQLLDVETQLQWLREIGFENVDCLWKWRELALLRGNKGMEN